MLRLHKIPEVDGVLADIGVSSHQFNEGVRGFSTRFADADSIWMDQRQPTTAAEGSKPTASELHKIFERYGEVAIQNPGKNRRSAKAG